MPAAVMLRSSPAPASRTASLRQELLKNLDRPEDYPMLTDTTLRAMAMVNDANVSSAEVATLIRRDPVVAAAVLRRANNWMTGGRGIDNIQQAVLRVGLQECGKLLCMMGLRAMSAKCPSSVQELCDGIHRHSLFVAQLASEINRTVGFGFSGVEFTTGLLHDIGRVILFVNCPQAANQTPPTSAIANDIITLEREIYGIDHCAIGYQFALRNNLPDHLVRAILNHHRPEDDQIQPELVSLIAMANRIANFTQWEHNISGYDLTRCPVFPVMAKRWSGQREEAFTQALPGIVVRALRNTRVMMKSFR